jgi:hypothetical protein
MEPVLDRHAPVDATVTVRNDGNGILSYAGTGFAQPGGASGKTPTSRVVLCDVRGNQQIGDNGNSTARAMLIEPTGRTRITRNVAEVADAINAAGVGGCPQ